LQSIAPALTGAPEKIQKYSKLEDKASRNLGQFCSSNQNDGGGTEIISRAIISQNISSIPSSSQIRVAMTNILGKSFSNI
jgi:hypothetical protein